MATGAATTAMKNETVSDSAIVKARGLKNAPVMPARSENGRKMMIVDRLEPIRPGMSSRSEERTGSGLPSSR